MLELQMAVKMGCSPSPGGMGGAGQEGGHGEVDIRMMTLLGRYCLQEGALLWPRMLC